MISKDDIELLLWARNKLCGLYKDTSEEQSISILDRIIQDVDSMRIEREYQTLLEDEEYSNLG